MSTRIGIIGAGAVGCVVSGLLTRAGHDVAVPVNEAVVELFHQGGVGKQQPDPAKLRPLLAMFPERAGR